MILRMTNYRPQTKLQEGNIFNHVCLPMEGCGVDGCGVEGMSAR